MRKRIALVFNPKGGSSSQAGVNALVHALAARGATVLQYPTTPEPGSGAQLAKVAVAENAEAVIGYGGDGTISLVAEGLIGTGMSMAAYPGGTGNMFARSYYPVPRPDRFAQMVLEGIPQPIDLLRLTYRSMDGREHVRRILNCAAIGCLSDSIAEVSQDVKRIFGQAAYVFNLMCTATRLQPRYLRVTCTDQGKSRSFRMASSILMIANTFPPLASYLSRGCSASDGLMDIINIGATNFVELMSTGFWTMLLRPDRSAYYQRLRTESVTIESDSPVTPNIDGDFSPMSDRLQIDVEPGAARVILV